MWVLLFKTGKVGEASESQTVKVKHKDAQYSPGCDFT